MNEFVFNNYIKIVYYIEFDQILLLYNKFDFLIIISKIQLVIEGRFNNKTIE